MSGGVPPTDTVPRRRPARWEVALFAVYVLWSIVAVLEIVLRKKYGHSPLPGFLADHNGNIAVSGFIMAAAFPGAALLRIARRRGNRVLAIAGAACVPTAALGWGVFFVLMEFVPLYEPNTADWLDVPGSVFGLVCGAYFGWRLQQQLGAPANRGHRRSVRSERR